MEGYAVNSDMQQEQGLIATDASDQPETDPAALKLIEQWAAKIKKAEAHYKTAFKRMRQCTQLAKDGARKDWIDKDNYTVPVLNRYINQAVAVLYAKNPKAQVKRKKRMMFQLWDEKEDSLQAALQNAMLGDPNAMAILEEVSTAVQYNTVLDKTSKTLELLWDYYTSEQENGFKSQLKALVRRVKVTAVGYVKLCYQRELQANPEITARISDVTEKIAQFQRLLHEYQEGELFPDMAEYAQLQSLLADLQSQEMMVVREGPVFDFPKSDEIIIDPNCRHLKTLAGANWIAHRFDKTPEEIEEIYGVDVAGCFDSYDPEKNYSDKSEQNKKDNRSFARVYEVWDRKSRQVFTICEGYKGYLRAPAEPDVKIERFYTIFPLVFNEVEHEDEIFPPSDVWQARHIQDEYNRSREGLREHRIANRPYYVMMKGAMEETDLKLLSHHDSHAIVELNGLGAGQSVEQLLQRGPNVPIDPNQYEVEMHYSDLQRVVGVQEANLGGTGSSTATESSIAEQSRSAGLADNVDDLDDMLSNLAHAFGQLCFSELSKETVVEIAGPGAVWPDAPLSRQELAKDLQLDIKAGSSGRPNRAAELANLERAMPIIMQLPGMNPKPLSLNYLDLLDIDYEDAFLEGLPSIQAVNAMMTKPPGGALAGPEQSMGGADQPALQGANGANNMQGTAPQEPGPQPGYPQEVVGAPGAITAY